MKILFLIGSNPVDAVSTWDEIKIYKDKGHLTPSKDYYSIFKAMERNTTLEEAILSARTNIGIPTTGMTWNDYYKNYYLKSLSTYNEKESKKYNDLFQSLDNEAKRIVKDINPHIYVANQIKNLILGGFVFPEDIPLTCGATQNDEQDPTLGNSEVFIHINHPVTQNELKTYIENHWLHIYSLMKSLPSKPKFYISKRDLRIVELKDNTNYDWDKIMDLVTNEFELDDYEGKLNAVSIKRAYNRAKERIMQTAKKSTSDK